MEAFAIVLGRGVLWNKRGWSRHSEWVRSWPGIVMGKQPASCVISTCFLCLVLWVSKRVVASTNSSHIESRFLTAFLLVPVVFKSAKGTHFPSFWLQGGVSKMYFELLTPHEFLWACEISHSFTSPPRSAVLNWWLLFPSYPNPCRPSYTALVV